jgi:hypothetical protein
MKSGSQDKHRQIGNAGWLPKKYSVEKFGPRPTHGVIIVDDFGGIYSLGVVVVCRVMVSSSTVSGHRPLGFQAKRVTKIDWGSTMEKESRRHTDDKREVQGILTTRDHEGRGEGCWIVPRKDSSTRRHAPASATVDQPTPPRSPSMHQMQREGGTCCGCLPRRARHATAVNCTHGGVAGGAVAGRPPEHFQF